MGNNQFYTASGNPQTESRGASALIRSEFLAIQNAFSQVANVAGINSAVDTGTANNYIVSPSPAMTGYGEFVNITFAAANTNTGPSTINANGLGAINITRRDGSALLAGDIQAGGVYTATGDGIELQLQANPLSGNATGPINFGKANSVASASNIVLDSMTANYGHITGTTSISEITLASGAMRQVVFDAALTLANGPSLILPSGQNITTASGDSATFVGEGAGVTRCISYIPASGQSVSFPLTGLTKISSVTLSSAAASINFLSSFSSQYSGYLIEIEGFVGDGAGNLQMQMGVGGSTDGGSTYNSYGLSSHSGGISQFGSGSNFFNLSSNVPDNTAALGAGLNGRINFTNVNASSTSVGMFSQISYHNQSVGAGYFYETSGGSYPNTPSGFRLYLSSGGNIGVGTTVKLYGYQK